jgi:hypothetical protein
MIQVDIINTHVDVDFYQLFYYSLSLVIENARSCLGKEYSLSCRNCKHFVVWCKTGTASRSETVDSVTRKHGKNAGTVAVGGGVALGAIGLNASGVGLTLHAAAINGGMIYVHFSIGLFSLVIIYG